MAEGALAEARRKVATLQRANLDESEFRFDAREREREYEQQTRAVGKRSLNTSLPHNIYMPTSYLLSKHLIAFFRAQLPNHSDPLLPSQHTIDHRVPTPAPYSDLRYAAGSYAGPMHAVETGIPTTIATILQAI